MIRYLTPSEVIERNRQQVAEACPQLVSLHADRGQGALSAMCCLGLIDGATYIEAGRDLYELAQLRRVELRA